MLSSLLAGFGLGLSLIVAIGAQNLFVLRQGIRREHVLAVVTVCAVSDAVLIALGVSGVGAVVTAVPWLLDVVRWAGALFLVGYGVVAARRSLRPAGFGLHVEAHTAAPARGAAVDTRTRTTTRAAAVLTCLALTWLNPHVYLDTVFLLGSVAATHGAERGVFGVGAAAASLVWFAALGFGARYLGRWLDSPKSWRVLDGVIALVMWGLAISLVLPVFTG
ncbi:LysE/ArgO family amino acid transporter [Microbacterium sp. RURRCA19A]|uniref:LysE/ArgO family amino acid transporter n=1 Tax=Microbacterium sp. RURRCA19A TaxID=1907391 RepID=UPI00095459D7|nr:LysE/ArgO family amino acid transporter [Microbacterium sp. RURRCA19A]SIS13650.1 L-lysine exporter family protein LysE/ArgO [Microbacterium sp. RURRCA19A]